MQSPLADLAALVGGPPLPLPERSSAPTAHEAGRFGALLAAEAGEPAPEAAPAPEVTQALLALLPAPPALAGTPAPAEGGGVDAPATPALPGALQAAHAALAHELGAAPEPLARAVEQVARFVTAVAGSPALDGRADPLATVERLAGLAPAEAATTPPGDRADTLGTAERLAAPASGEGARPPREERADTLASGERRAAPAHPGPSTSPQDDRAATLVNGERRGASALARDASATVHAPARPDPAAEAEAPPEHDGEEGSRVEASAADPVEHLARDGGGPGGEGRQSRGEGKDPPASAEPGVTEEPSPFLALERAAPAPTPAEIERPAPAAHAARRLADLAAELLERRPANARLDLTIQAEDGTDVRLVLAPSPQGGHRLAFVVGTLAARDDLERSRREIERAARGLPVALADISIDVEERATRSMDHEPTPPRGTARASARGAKR